jgi:hypothetical protein
LVAEGYVDFTLANDVLLDERFGNLSLLILYHSRPCVVEGFGFGEHGVTIQFIHFEDIHLRLEFGEFSDELVRAFSGLPKNAVSPSRT